MKKHSSFLVTLGVLILILVSYLVFINLETTNQTGKITEVDLIPVKIGGAPAFELMLPTLIGMSQGYFEKQGLEIEEFIQGSGSDMRTALLSGDLDIGLLAFVHIPLARLRDQDVKIVSSVYDKEIFSLVVRKELENEVKSVSDLKGMKIGIAKPGSGTWAVASSYFSKAGLDPEKDIDFITVGNNSQTVYNALKTGQIDAYPTFEPMTSTFIQEGVVFPLIKIWDKDEHEYWVGESAMSMVLAAKEDTIEQNATLVQKFVNVHNQAANYIKEHNSQEIADTLISNQDTVSIIGNIEKLTLVAMLERIKDNFNTGTLSKEAYEVEMDLYVSTGVLEKAVPFEEAVAQQFTSF